MPIIAKLEEAFSNLPKTSANRENFVPTAFLSIVFHFIRISDIKKSPAEIKIYRNYRIIELSRLNLNKLSIIIDNMQKPQFVKNQIYHIYNRGVEKRDIFLDKQDYFRFIHSLFVFNDQETVINTLYYFNPNSTKIESRQIEKEKKPRKLLVEILIFTLMPNHFHLVLRQKKENGVVKFMQKLGTGYTMYFNKKYTRVGSLFQGRFRACLINKEPHFIHLPFYIHTNPIDLFNYRGSTSIIEFLEKYRWSSFLDYIGKRNFPSVTSVTSRKFLLEFFGGPKEYRKATREWLKEREKNTEKIKEIRLED